MSNKKKEPLRASTWMEQSTLLFGKNAVLIFAEFLTAVRAFYARSKKL
jgi:hypothetical protein